MIVLGVVVFWLTRKNDICTAIHSDISLDLLDIEVSIEDNKSFIDREYIDGYTNPEKLRLFDFPVDLETPSKCLDFKKGKNIVTCRLYDTEYQYEVFLWRDISLDVYITADTAISFVERKLIRG